MKTAELFAVESGVGIQAVTQDLAEAFGMKTPRGAVITQLEKGQPGEKAGLKVGDIVVALKRSDHQQRQRLAR